MAKRFSEPKGGSGMGATPWLVRCPRCDRCARMESSRLSCGHCGLAREGYSSLDADGHARQTLGRQGRWRRDRTPRLHWPVQHRETYDLWLRVTCCGGRTVWATNPEHLAYLEAYVGADLREGKHLPGLQRKLPAWLKDAKHRDEVLRALAKLRASLAEAGG